MFHKKCLEDGKQKGNDETKYQILILRSSSLNKSSDKNNSYIQQYLGAKICNMVYAFKRESAVKIMIVLHCMG